MSKTPLHIENAERVIRQALTALPVDMLAQAHATLDPLTHSAGTKAQREYAFRLATLMDDALAQSRHQEGIRHVLAAKRPANWDDMGSSEKDLWEDRDGVVR